MTRIIRLVVSVFSFVAWNTFVIALSSIPSYGAFIYDNITTDEISPAAGFYGGGSGFSGAFNFVPASGQNYVLQEVDVSVLADNDLDPTIETVVEVSLYADSNGFPGTLLESLATQAPNRYPPMTNSITTLQSVLHPTLIGGHFYWLAIGSAANSVSNSWLVNDTNDFGVYALRITPSDAWRLLNPVDDPIVPKIAKGAFRIIGTPIGPAAPVPEPTTLSFVILGISLLIATRVSRRSLTQLSQGDPRVSEEFVTVRGSNVRREPNLAASMGPSEAASGPARLSLHSA